MISVCMATYNGEDYLKEQIDSILFQLSEEDELVISDDHSIDNTSTIIQSYHDRRIKYILNDGIKGVTHNFENALMHANGDIIFLADQDDVWFPNKVKEMTQFLMNGNYDLIMSNCSLTDSGLNIVKKEFYDEYWPMKKGLIANIYKCACLGCCLAFTRQALTAMLPFPSDIVLHDLWIFLFSITNLRVGYIGNSLMLYRRHSQTVTFAGRKSKNTFFFKVYFRIYAVLHLLFRTIQFQLHSFFNNEKY
jgi:glycosyltransferase involved in cell wall biosynthesis